MFVRSHTRWLGFVPLLLLLSVLGGCDVPTSAPSLSTDTSVDAPLVAEKTFSFLGGPTSTHDPLIDTTRAGVRSLFAVHGSGKTVFVEQEVQDLGRGTLNGTLDKAARGVQIDTSFAGPIAQENAIATQAVHASYERTNGTFESPGRTDATPVPAPPGASDVTLPFPVNRIIAPPTTAVVDAAGATVERVTLTEGNELTFTLTNNRQTTPPLTNGNPGTAPEIAIRTENGPNPLSSTPIGTSPLPPGKTRSITVDVSGVQLGRNSTIVIRIAGSGQDDKLTTDSRPGLRYHTATLSNPRDIRVQTSATGLPTPGRTASRFAGLHVEHGALNVHVENDLGFPLSINRLSIKNNTEALGLLPHDFPPLDRSVADNSPLHVQSGGSAVRSVELGGTGVARQVDVSLTGRPAQSNGTVTLHARGGLKTVAQGNGAISKMHFWPAGEQLHTSGTIPLSPDHMSFDREGDFVEIGASTVRLQKLTNELGVAFDSFTLSYPGIRLPDANNDDRRYAAGDSLSISLVDDPSGPYEFAALRQSDARDFKVSIPSLRFLPTNNALRFHLNGTMETVPSTTKEHLRVLRVEEEIRADLSIDQFEVEALRGTVPPFSVDITPDADGDGRLDVADDAEVRETSVQQLQNIAQHVDGLQFQGGALTLSVETDLGAKTRFYGALMGQTSDGPTFLAGKGPQRVPSSDPMGQHFERNGRPLGSDRLIQFNVEGGPPNQSVTRSVTLTDENSTLDRFLNQLPTRLRFAGKSRINGRRLHLRKPVQFDVGLGFRIPLAFKDRFSYQDTLDVDLAGLEAFTDPNKRVTISSADLRIDYTNTIPLDVEATVHVVGENGRSLVSLPSSKEAATLKAAPKTNDGAAASPRNETLTLDLDPDAVRSLARGRALRLQLTMIPQDTGPTARIRSDDTLRLSVGTDIDASVQTSP